MALMEEDVRAPLLDRYYKEIHATMLAFQSHTLGLFPRGESQHARVRDNVYCATALWCFSLAYRQVGDDKGRTHELEQSAVKCMRGLLFCYMRQAQKVELFKHRQSWDNALHARFDYMTGDHVTDDESWGHLQIDGTSLYLLQLAQMTASGVQVIFTMDEVDFIQNLVYYVERAYRIPDYGMWERGSRDNVGRRELHASSIGMAKAALDAMNGMNLFGEQGSLVSIIHVDPDAQYRNSVILNNLLPKESSSKETDASLLCISGYPAFAIDDPALRKKTEAKVKELLEGRHGFKRFLRDGHHTVRENRGRKHYNPDELMQFEGIECEWPLFFLLLVLTEMCHVNNDEADKYWKKFEEVEKSTEIDGHVIVPRLFCVPESELSDEGGTTLGSMLTLRDLSYHMEPMVEEVPFMMAQAIFFITKIAREGLITVNDLDPLGFHLPHRSRHSGMTRHLVVKAPGHDNIIQVALIAETARLQAILATHGIPTQTQRQVEPIKIRAPQDILMKVLHHIGENNKLGLSGRPNRPIGALGTSKVYRILGQTVVFYPTDSMADFYTSFDVMILIDTLKYTLQFLNMHWNTNGRPTLCLYLTEHQLKGSNFHKFVNFLAQVKQGEVEGAKVRLDRLQSLISTSCIEHLECTRDEDLDIQLKYSLINPLRSRSSAVHLSTSTDASSNSLFTAAEETFTVDDIEIHQLEDESEEIQPSFGPTDIRDNSIQQLRTAMKREQNPLGQLYILHELTKRDEKQFDMHMSIDDRVEDIYEEAGEKRHWTTVRLAAAILRKVVDCLAPSVTSMLVRGKEVTIGIFGYSEHVISEPLSPKEIVHIVYEKCMPHDPIEAVLHQEIIIYLADYISSSFYNPVFDGMLRLRIGWIIQAMKNELGRIDKTRSLQQLAPYEVKELLIRVLKDDDDSRNQLHKRQLNGALNRVPHGFYQKVFGILERIPGGIYVRGKNLPQVPTIYEVASHEMNFALKVEEFLGSITFPEYRQMVVELLMVVSTVLERNCEVNFSGTLNLDDLLQDSILHFNDDKKKTMESKDQPDSKQEDSTSYACHRSGSFYSLFPDGMFGSASYMAKAVVNRMLQEGLQYDPSKGCVLS